MNVDGPLYGPFPWPHHWALARVAAGHPRRDHPHQMISDELLDAATQHIKAWSNWRKRQEAKAREERRRTLPHRNWDARVPGCWVGVAEPIRKPTLKHGRWERTPVRCGRRAIAFDVTDTRAMGGVYGACAQHLLRALADDPSRSWMWNDGRPLDRENDDVESECVVAVLAR